MQGMLMKEHKKALVFYGIIAVVCLFAFVSILAIDDVSSGIRFTFLPFFSIGLLLFVRFWIKERKEYKRAKKLGL